MTREMGHHQFDAMEKNIDKQAKDAMILRGLIDELVDKVVVVEKRVEGLEGYFTGLSKIKMDIVNEALKEIKPPEPKCGTCGLCGGIGVVYIYHEGKICGRKPCPSCAPKHNFEFGFLYEGRQICKHCKKDKDDDIHNTPDQVKKCENCIDTDSPGCRPIGKCDERLIYWTPKPDAPKETEAAWPKGAPEMGSVAWLPVKVVSLMPHDSLKVEYVDQYFNVSPDDLIPAVRKMVDTDTPKQEKSCENCADPLTENIFCMEKRGAEIDFDCHKSKPEPREKGVYDCGSCKVSKSDDECRRLLCPEWTSAHPEDLPKPDAPSCNKCGQLLALKHEKADRLERAEELLEIVHQNLNVYSHLKKLIRAFLVGNDVPKA